MATISDVARRAEVSEATVSRTLNNNDYVKSETKQKVFKAVEELGYTPSLLAKGMRNKKTKTFGIFIPNFGNLYYTELLGFIEEEARKQGYIAIICTGQMNGERENAYIDHLLSRQVDGLILCCYTSILENIALTKNITKKTPIVVTDQPSAGRPVSAVYVDGYNGFKKLVSYIINLGHKKIAMIRGRHYYPCSEMRYKAYLDTLKGFGIRIREDFIIESEFTAAGGYNAAKQLLTGNEKPSAIVGANDIMAIGALKYANEHHFLIPEDVAVAGFDNIPLTSLVTPQLTTIQVPIQKIAEEAVRLLVRKIKNNRAHNREKVFEAELIVRQSTESSQKQAIMM